MRSLRLYKIFSLSSSIIFFSVGFIFLLIPDRVLVFFNALAQNLGMVPSPVAGVNFYVVLAVAYMYLVGLLSLMMYRYPRKHVFSITAGKWQIGQLAAFAICFFCLLSVSDLCGELSCRRSDWSCSLDLLSKNQKNGYMNLRLLAVNIYIPAFIKRKKLDELFQLTAHAFGCDAPRGQGRSYNERLKSYATFTRSQAEKCLQEGTDLNEVKTELFQSAYRLGGKIRRDFRLRSLDEVMEMSQILYRILGIDFKGKTCGDVAIKSCFFSEYYSPQICQLISSLDEGLAAGLSEGGRLSFSQRITEDKDSCKARFVMPEKKHE